ncbi:cupin domain-containing protein [Aduncisulcus paluster]|uniref:Cupin domain-containing protein n=1 Tax=Aduncisulcus paluster TaxID=2918883 RepID=A0ABQ5KHA7_9EUKA|nr:cupin domain-containing protein [Aduncisulcus paluster]
MSEINTDNFFGQGEDNTAYAKYFVGQSYLNILNTEGVFIANVTFEPGCHSALYLRLRLVSGMGKPARALKPGDVVHIPAGVKHWHGATKDGWFSHLSVEVPGEDKSNEWLEPVSDEDYNSLG